MARTAAELPAGIRLTDHVSLGVLTAQFPMEVGEHVLFETERCSQRERDLPAHVMVYYVIALALALALYADVSTGEVLRCLTEGARRPLPRRRCRRSVHRRRDTPAAHHCPRLTSRVERAYRVRAPEMTSR